MNKLTLRDLSQLTKGKIIGNEHIDEPIEHLLFDSRRLNFATSTVFFAITTKNHNATKYITELYNKGIRLFVCQNGDISIYADASYLIVDNVVNALQLLATKHREKFNIPILAITGSNGKTITKEWIVNLISTDKRVCFNPKSFNSQIGVPVSVYQLKEGDELAIFEAGISLPNEMEKLQRIIQPSIGIFTNIGDAHQINFSSSEEKIDEKLKLFYSSQRIIFHDYNSLLTNKIISFAKAHNIKLIVWGENPIDKKDLDIEYIKFSDIEKEISLPFSDYASVENAINSYLFCKYIGISTEKLKERIKNLHQLESRLEIRNGINNSVIVNDAYSCDLKSLEIALDYLNLQGRTKKTVILSDIQQSDDNLNELYYHINTLLLNKHIDNLVAIGKDFYNNRSAITIKNSKFYLTVEEFLSDLKRRDFTNKAILIKGASRMNFNRISEALSLKAHQSVLEINLTALNDNVRYFKSLIDKRTLVMAMVKASSYGCGGYEVAMSLEKNNLVDYFTVAFADEGVELRQQGVKKPIMVMTPEDNTALFTQYNLEPVIHSLSTLEKFISLNINIHIKLDTGMHRLGFEEKDLQPLVSKLKEHSNVRIKSIFSHLYGADEVELDRYTYEQIAKYEQMSEFIKRNFSYTIICHLCNSAATVRFPQAHYDMVRLGVGMYGIGVDANTQKHLRFVHRLKTCITQVREIEKNEDVSYSRKFVSDKSMRIGVIPIGYADGLNRHLGKSKLSVCVNGQFCNIIGNICMDMCILDLTNTSAKEGDEVVIFGDENPVFKLSNVLDTIPYEIFTSISARIKRVYYSE